jgi:hypothetical protein
MKNNMLSNLLNFKINLPILLLAVVGTALTGCESTSKIRDEGATPGVSVRADDAPNARISMNSVNIIDKGLQRLVDGNKYVGKIAIENHGTRRTETNTLEVYVVIRNRTDYNLMIEGRIQFYDRDQVPIEGPTAWQRVNLAQNGVSAYKEFSTNYDVGFYYVEIREAR